MSDKPRKEAVEAAAFIVNALDENMELVDVTARRIEDRAIRPVADPLADALDDMVADCPDCGGKGVVYTFPGETDIGMPPGSSGQDCRRCAKARAALAAYRGEGK